MPESPWDPEPVAAPSNLPRTRGECVDGARPCPLVSCRYHLYLDVETTGNIAINFPETKRLGRRQTFKLEAESLDVAEALISMPATCALDVADRGEHILASVAACLGVTRERARQIEAEAEKSLRRLPILQELSGRK